MIQRLIHSIFARRHYWRVASFSEIAELYSARLLFTFALNLVNLFAAVWLYKLGYSVVFIALIHAGFYAVRAFVSYFAARYAAYFGPKHGVLMAGLLRTPSLIAFMFVPEFGLPAIIAFGVFQQISASLYDISYLVDFSKVKSLVHPGKEIGTMQIMEKIARIVSPIVGGIVASTVSPQAAILVAAVMFIASAVPLLQTIEQVPLKAKMKFAGFPWRHAARSLVAEHTVGFDFVASGLAWSLFLTVVIFAGYGDSVYAAIGGLAAIGVIASMVAVWVFGRIVDRHKGDVLLSLGVISNVVIHTFRSLIYTPVSAAMINIANESATSAYSIPLTRVIFDVADSSGFRIAYIMFVEIMVGIGAVLACLVLALLASLLGEDAGLRAMFVVAAMVELSLLIVRRQAK